MKKRLLKKPIEKILLLINSIIFVIIGTGIESLVNKENVLALIILLVVFILNHLLLIKYTKIFK